MSKKQIKRTVNYFKIGAVSTIGASVLSGMGGGTVGANVVSGVGRFSTSFPVVGSVLGAGYVIGHLQGLIKQTKKLRRR